MVIESNLNDTTKIVFWHRELPPLEAELVAEHTVEANSHRVPGTLAHRDELWDQCYRELPLLRIMATRLIGPRRVTAADGQPSHTKRGPTVSSGSRLRVGASGVVVIRRAANFRVPSATRS
jgi:hypothetical protein